MKPTISIIAAISENRALGKNNKLLWHIPQDLKRFKALTTGHPIIMGRKTFESIGRPLPNRFNIVLTRDALRHEEEIHFVPDLVGAIKLAEKLEMNHKNPEIFIIGGGNIYAQALPLADKLYLTLVKGNFDADTFFPDYFEFNEVVSEKAGKDENYEYTFVDLVRKNK